MGRNPGESGGVGQEPRRLAAEAGRDAGAIPITVFSFGRPNRERLGSYAELGVERIVIPPPTMMRHDDKATLDWLDQWAPIMADMGAAPR